MQSFVTENLLIDGGNMYLKTIHSVNIGPIDDVKINFPFNEDKTPKPVVLVGENGTGKSILLSNIVDSFYELAGKSFDDALKKDNLSFNQEFYKIIASQEIKIGKTYLYAYILYENEDSPNNSIKYLFKSGSLSANDFYDLEGMKPDDFTWKDIENYKNVRVDHQEVKNIFAKNVFCYFPPSRYERPNWLGIKYYAIENFEHPTVREKFSDRLDKPISVVDVTSDTLQWLLDVIADSRCDVEHIKGDTWKFVHGNTSNLRLLNIARKNLEEIMSTILGEEVYFGLNYRNSNGSRFNINSINNNMIIPNLNALSTGQSALFNMFATIIRYADINDLNKSIRLEDITGIVVIDEIELHLHSNLQRDVLPKLLKKFPKVQFIISSHSPLFLLGMDELYGSVGYEIYQMPSAIRITAERFSEFEKAYRYLMNTEKHQQEIRDIIQDVIKQHTEKPLIITEGQSDWKHMKTAFQNLKSKPEYTEYLNMNLDFLEYDSNTNMGNSNLVAMCQHFSKVRQARKVIFIADADDKKTNNELEGSNSLPYKNWGNNVFSFVLPVPEHRTETPEICIEHYYTDEEIKIPTQIGEKYRRLYMGNEFNQDGISLNKDLVCRDRNSCGNGKINIIDGSNGKPVYDINDPNQTNLALPKMKFADGILKRLPEFANIDFKNFHLIFDIIKQILDQPIIIEKHD